MIVLEVGPGSHPVMPSMIESLEHEDSMFYISLEDGSAYIDDPSRIGEAALQYTNNTIEKLDCIQETAHRYAVMIGTAQQIPLADETVDEAVLCNVLGQYNYFENFEGTHDLLDELRRVVKGSGRLTVYESISPPRLPAVVSLLAQAGFSTALTERSKPFLIRPRSSVLRELDQQYGKHPIDAWLTANGVPPLETGIFGRRYFVQAVPTQK